MIDIRGVKTVFNDMAIERIVNNHELEIEGKVENAEGKIPEKIGKIENIIDK